MTTDNEKTREWFRQRKENPCSLCKGLGKQIRKIPLWEQFGLSEPRNEFDTEESGCYCKCKSCFGSGVKGWDPDDNVFKPKPKER